ncbi:hypothetical protein [Virgibacillus proomii]|uniref:hypothetical protein n=1 Tax=Virgibacillus proomii TaxID=84407 RepID=UPI00209E2352|nr:hypothetical protein [Virgibacillus proomii]
MNKYFYTLGLRRAAEKSYEVYSEESIEALKWFASDVNAYIEDIIIPNPSNGSNN